MDDEEVPEKFVPRRLTEHVWNEVTEETYMQYLMPENKQTQKLLHSKLYFLHLNKHLVCESQ